MIIELKVSNFRSIHKRQTFSMVAGTGSELKDNCRDADSDSNLRLVCSSVIYGANASGKSNLLSALSFVRFLIINSAKDTQRGESLPLANFAFNDSSLTEPSEFEITFIKEKARYQYGFTADKNQIFEEWLFAYPSGKAQKWFSRVYDRTTEKYSWNFSKFFKGGRQIADLTRSNVLFFSNAIFNNNEQLSSVFDWFQKDLIFIDSPSRHGLVSNSSIELLKTEEGKERVLKLMLAADSSISDIELETQKPNEKDMRFPNSMPPEVQEYFKTKMTEDRTIINFKHAENVSFDLNEESEGTRRLLVYAGFWINALDNGKILIVDELDNSLHPLLVRLLIKLISNPEINKKNAQLIFTTHDTSLLDNELFRRDQIWFVEKDKSNATQLYSLLDFSPRKNEAFGKGYLQGRYGALPVYVNEWRF